MRATVRIRIAPHYRRDAFINGLEAAGFEVGNEAHPRTKRDLLVVWNRMAQFEHQADDWERRGGTVLVVENGYLGCDANGHQLYAIAVHGHNGSGWIPDAGEDRFAPLGIELKPWCSNPGGHVLICAQRGIGSRQMASPSGWDWKTARHLAKMGVKNVRVRQHPGRMGGAPQRALDEDLAGARVAVIWSSASGLRALQLGIPVVYTAPHWIGSAGARRGLEGVAAPLTDDAARLQAMQHAAHGQWRLDEIVAGKPFSLIVEQLEHARW